MRRLYITAKYDRLFHISQISQLSDRQNYLPVILDRFVRHPSHIAWEMTGTTLYMKAPFPLPPQLHASLRSLSSAKILSKPLFFPVLPRQGNNRALQHIHIHSPSLAEFIPHSHGVVFTDAFKAISITGSSNPTTNIRRPYRIP